MDTVKVEKGNVKMIAHRGLSGIECENTCAAFVAAANRSYFGIETDVHVTADGHFVIIHDDNTARVGDRDLNVEKSTLEELKNVQLHQTNGEMRSDLTIPLLSDYIKICKKYGKTAILELKNMFAYNDIKRLIEEIKSLDYLEQTVFISFFFENLVAVRDILPTQKVQFLTGSTDSATLSKLINYKMDLDVIGYAVTKQAVDTMHQNGLEVNCWTIDKKEDAEQLIAAGVDYITSNILE